jgi:uncharacterized protein YqgC (DUF456 family)
MIYLWATLLFVANLASWISNLFLIPGNWLIVLASALYAWLLRDSTGPHLTWTVVIVVTVLALVGEIVEFAAGAAGASKRGGSRRGMMLAVIGTLAGSLLGAAVGVPIPVVGSLVGALLFGTLGAFVGAYLGETWAGKAHHERIDISTAAMIGRILGTSGKLIIGLMMVVIVALDSFFDLSR